MELEQYIHIFYGSFDGIVMRVVIEFDSIKNQLVFCGENFCRSVVIGVLREF